MKYTTTKLYKSGDLLLIHKKVYVFLYLQRINNTLFMVVYGERKICCWNSEYVVNLNIDVQTLFQQIKTS
jgi:hypothetical protein